MTNERSTPCDISEVPEQPTNQTLLDHRPDAAPDTERTILAKTAILNLGASADNLIAKSIDPTRDESFKSQIREQLSQMREEDVITAILALSDKENDTGRSRTPRHRKGPSRHRSKSRSHRAISITPRGLSDKEKERNVYSPISLGGRMATPSGSDGREQMVPEIHPTCAERQHSQTRAVMITPPGAATHEPEPEIKADSAPRLQVCEESTSPSNMKENKSSGPETFAVSNHLEQVSRFNRDNTQQETKVELDEKLFSYNRNTTPANTDKELLGQGFGGPQNATAKKTDVPGTLEVSHERSSCSCSPLEKVEEQMGQAERSVPKTSDEPKSKPFEVLTSHSDRKSDSTARTIGASQKASLCNCTTPISDRQNQVVQQAMTTFRGAKEQPVQPTTEEITDMTEDSQEQPQQLATVESAMKTEDVQMRQSVQDGSNTLQKFEGKSLDVARFEESVSTARAAEEHQEASPDQAITPVSEQQEQVVQQAITTFRGAKEQPVQRSTEMPTDMREVSRVGEQPEHLPTTRSPRKDEEAQTRQVEQGVSKTFQRSEGKSLDVARSRPDEESVTTARVAEEHQEASSDRAITPNRDQQEQVVQQGASFFRRTKEQSVKRTTEKPIDMLGVSRVEEQPEQLATAKSPMKAEEAQMRQSEQGTSKTFQRSERVSLDVARSDESVSTARATETPQQASLDRAITPTTDQQEQVVQQDASSSRRTKEQSGQRTTEKPMDMLGVSRVEEQPEQPATAKSPMKAEGAQMRQNEQGASNTLQKFEGKSLDVARSEESVSTARATEKPPKTSSDQAITPTRDQQEQVVQQGASSFRRTKEQSVQPTTEKPMDMLGISRVEEQPDQLATAKSPVKTEEAQMRQSEQGTSKILQKFEGKSSDVARSRPDEESVTTARASEEHQKASSDRAITPIRDQQERVVRQTATTPSGTNEQSFQCKEHTPVKTSEGTREQCQLGIISQHEHSIFSTRETPQKSIDSMIESKMATPSNQQTHSMQECASVTQTPQKSEQSGPQQQQESDLLAVNSHREKWFQDCSKIQKGGGEQAISAAKYRQVHDTGITTASEKSPRRKSGNPSQTHDDQVVTTAVARSPEAKPTGFSLGSIFPSLFGHSAPTDDSSSTSSAPVTGPPAVLRRPITFTYPEQPVRPKNPRRDVIQFRSEYANNFTLGSRHTVDFYGGSYDDVQREARNTVKLIVVFIHDPSLEESITFINDSLNSVEFGELVNKHNLLLWGVGNNTEEGKFVAYNLHVNKFPFLGLMCPRADNRFFSVRRITGFTTAEDLVMRLEKAIEIVRVDLKDLREQREKLLEDRRLMQEQEQAYRESAEKDKQRMLAAKKARQEKEEAEMREKRKQIEEKERRTLIASQREMLRKQVDDRPCGKETVSIQVRFPCGKKFSKQFALDDSLEKLFTAIICHESSPDFFTVATGFPRAEINCAPEWYHLVLSEQLIAEGSKPTKFKPPLTFRAAGFNRPVGVFVNSYGS
ncbi:hypothetical protein GCK32_008977 [Trichostrongylus colubriformis]|uniref:UBX domain-containing protein n=1 Tax=Trichostrongylus colubriformis TaxID=6319 RepID=A0AAN8G676_TRICO